MKLLPLRIACGIGIADSIVALATAVIIRPDPASFAFGAAWVVAWSLAFVHAARLRELLQARPWILVPVSVLAMLPAVLDGGYPGNLATQPVWIVLVAAAVLPWRNVLAVGFTLFVAKLGVFMWAGLTPRELSDSIGSGELLTAILLPLLLVPLGLIMLAALAQFLEVVARPWPSPDPVSTVTPVAAGGPPAPAGDALSKAEREVVELLADGLAPKQIAAARGTSLATVRTQIREAKKATGARTLEELVTTTARRP